ncbi:hypothetical protein GCM10011247_15280 [Pseudomonas plecoglossicida]|nr:hypothetical protein GCM10011247_15280 [Pseudomonas plecoglossicida]
MLHFRASSRTPPKHLAAVRPPNPQVALPNPHLLLSVSSNDRERPRPQAPEPVGSGAQKNKDNECLAYGKPPAERAQ